MSYNIHSDFFADERPNIHVPCLRAEQPDGTFIQLSHRGPIAFPLPYFVVRMDDDETLYAQRVQLLASNGTRYKTGKWLEHNGKLYEVYYDSSDTPLTRRLAHHNRATYCHTCNGVALIVDGENIFAMSYDGYCKLKADMTHHQLACLKTFCQNYGNDMTYAKLIRHWRDRTYTFNILDDLINELEGGIQ